MRTRATLMLLLALALAVTSLASEVALLEPTRRPVQDEPTGLGGLDDLDEVFYLFRGLDIGAEYYLGSGTVGDTFAVHYQPAAPCSILFAEMQWFSDGPYEAFIWEYNPACADLYPDGQAPERGQSPVSPLGDVLFGPFTNAAMGEQAWETMFDEGDLPGGGIRLDDGRAFMVGFAKTANEQPHPLADDVSDRGTTYSWFGGEWMSDYPNDWGAYTSNFDGTVVEYMMRVGVSYYGDVPPIVTAMTQLPDTPDPNKTCTVEASIIDDNGWNGDFARVAVQVGDLPIFYETMTAIGDDRFTASFTLDTVIGMEVTYWVEAMDDNGQWGTNQMNPGVFTVWLVNFDMPYLVVYNDYNMVSGLENGYDDSDFPCELWNVTDHDGVDHALIDAGWEAIHVVGWGLTIIPTRDYADDPFAAYLSGGGNLFFSDQDYFYVNGEDAYPTFDPGDFAYDFLGLVGGMNDPLIDVDQFYGVPDDPVSGLWGFSPYTVNFQAPIDNWTDVLDQRAEADPIFFDGMNDEITGVRFNTPYGGRVVTLSFASIFAADWSTGQMLPQWFELNNSVNDWMADNQPPLATLELDPIVSVIPPQGGDLPYTFMFQHNTGDTYPGVTYWNDVTLPNGALYGPTFEYEFTVLPYMSMAATLTLEVPGFAPPGNYTFHAHVGMAPVSMLDASFPFNKQAGVAGSVVTAWGTRGEIELADDTFDEVLPREFALSEARPNPFNPTTELTLSLPAAGDVRVELVDVLGRSVRTLLDGRQAAGELTLTVDGTDLASGLYIVRAAGAGRSIARKVMLLK